MLPGKTYTPDDFVRIAWARKWLIVIPTVLIASATVLVSHFLPNRYRAFTTILVVPQRVPESYVRSTVTVDVGDRLQTISQQILSRTRLERIVDEFNLYEGERKTLIMEDIIERMRTRDIKVELASRRGNDTSSFTVGFEASNPRTAMLVTERLASMFVQENLQDREVLADATNQFLQAQLEDARRRLIEQEKKLELFRRRNFGQLPEQVSSNLSMMQTTQLQMQANLEAASKERDRLLSLEQAIADAIANARAQMPALSRASDEAPPGTAAQRLEAARAELRNLELRLKPQHPDISRARRAVAELEAKAEQEAQLQPLGADPDQLQAALPADVAARVSAMRIEADEIRRRLETRKQDEERLNSVMKGYTARLETTPALESEMTELMRDYSTLKDQYTTLLRKSEDSKIAVNLERRQIGEQFRVIDGARLPERPVSPNRWRINLIGSFGGLLIAIGLLALLEYRDTTLKTDDDVVVSLALPVLAVIPAMITTTERQRMKRRRVLTIAASLASVVVIAIAVAWRYQQLLQAWVR